VVENEFISILYHKDFFMNLKHTKCQIEGCIAKHKGHGYCQNHLEKFKRGTLEIYPHSKLCSYSKCFNKHYAAGYCVMHRQRNIKGLPMDMKYASKNEYLRGNLSFEHRDVNSWAKAVKQFFGKACMICGWDKASCDTHHIQEKSQGGLNTLRNAVVVCPNHHAEIHAGRITKEELYKINTDTINLLILVEPKGENNDLDN